VTNCFVIYYLLNRNEQILKNQDEFYGGDVSKLFYISLLIMCVLNSLALIFVTHLIIFHIELKIKGLTTYEFLKLKSNNNSASKIVVRINQTD